MVNGLHCIYMAFFQSFWQRAVLSLHGSQSSHCYKKHSHTGGCDDGAGTHRRNRIGPVIFRPEETALMWKVEVKCNCAKPRHLQRLHMLETKRGSSHGCEKKVVYILMKLEEQRALLLLCLPSWVIAHHTIILNCPLCTVGACHMQECRILSLRSHSAHLKGLFLSCHVMPGWHSGAAVGAVAARGLMALIKPSLFNVHMSAPLPLL